MHQRYKNFWLTVFICLIFTSQLAAQSDFSDLLARLPASANTLVMLHADKIFSSDVAMREGWKQRYQRKFANSPMKLPPDAQQFVLVADLDLRQLATNWESAVMRMDSDLSISAVATLVKGQTDEIVGLESVYAPRGATIVKFAPYEFGVMKPSNRQAVARWVRAAKSSSTAPLSSYLQSAARYPDRVGTEIIMAIDLTDALTQKGVHHVLDGLKVIKDNNIDSDQATDAILGIAGVTLGIRVTDKVTGSLKVDFTRSIGVLSEVAKPLLLEVLEEAGTSIEEFYDWEAQVSDRQIRINGQLTESGLTRIFSFLEVDASAVDDGVDAVADADSQAEKFPGDVADKNSPDPYVTKEYFDGVRKYLRDLKREHGAKSYYTIGKWFEKYANRIDRLPILNVDPEMLNYSASVVSQMRDCVEAIKGSGIRSGARSAQVTSGGGGYYGGSRSTGVPGVYHGGPSYGNMALFTSGGAQVQDAMRDVEAQRRAIRKQERAASSTDVRGIMRQVEEETSQMRRKMTEKYEMEF